MAASEPSDFTQVIDERPFVNPTKNVLQGELERLGVKTFRLPRSPSIDAAWLRDTVGEVERSKGVFIDGAFAFHLWSGVGASTNPLAQQLLALHTPKVLMGLQDDPHGGSLREYQALAESGILYLNTATSPQFFSRPHRDFVASSIDLEANYFKEGPAILGHRYELLPHAVALSEFHFPRPDREKISVLGVQYPYRKMARSSLRGAGLKCARNPTSLDRLLRLAATKSSAATREYRNRFLYALRTSAVSITCDGGVGYPVRKFFEIPASGAALVGRIPQSASNLGFLSGTNCMDVPDPSNVADAVQDLLGTPDRLFELAVNGHNMVLTRHSSTVRAKQALALLALESEHGVEATRWSLGVLLATPRGGTESNALELFDTLVR